MKIAVIIIYVLDTFQYVGRNPSVSGIPEAKRGLIRKL